MPALLQIWCSWASVLQRNSKYHANYPAWWNQVTPRWQKRARSCTRVVFGLVRWRSHNCLLTPPWYVGTISHATLFKERETETGWGEEVGGGWEEREESRYPATMYPNHAFELNLSKTWLITAFSILPSLFLSLSLHSRVFPLLPSPPQLLFVHPPQPPTPQPPPAANDLQKYHD